MTSPQRDEAPALPQARARTNAALGAFTFRTLAPADNSALLRSWFREPRAHFWGMQDHSEDEIIAHYEQLLASGHASAWIGLDRGRPSFLAESYDPAFHEISKHYRPSPGDVGMHVFVGPATVRVHGYTRGIFTALMHFMFDALGARRVVVEPDVRNTAIHSLNRAIGFEYAQRIQLHDKLAHLAFCTRDAFHATLPESSCRT